MKMVKDESIYDVLCEQRMEGKDIWFVGTLQLLSNLY